MKLTGIFGVTNVWENLIYFLYQKLHILKNTDAIMSDVSFLHSRIYLLPIFEKCSKMERKNVIMFVSYLKEPKGSYQVATVRRPNDENKVKICCNVMT